MRIISKPIRMIAVFWPNQNPIPYRFKVSEIDGSMTEIKVDKVISSTPHKGGGADCIIYECQSFIGNSDRRYVIKYLTKQCQWQLYKM